MKTGKLLLVTALMLLNITGWSQVKGNPQSKECGVEFFTNFPSGSLDSVALKNMLISAPQMGVMSQSLEFDLYSRFDPANPANPALPPSARWYHFLMTGVNGKEIVINMHNSDTRRPFFSYDGKEWQRFSKEECAVENVIRKKYEGDSVYIAYFVPYTEGYLKERIAEWGKRECVEVISIGESEHGLNMPLLVITDKSVAPKGKKVVYIHGRIHTSETPGSWHLDRMIDIISGESTYAQDLRKGIEFHILPFTNPDGVEEGMSRSNSNGINLEVNYNSPDSVTAKEVKNILGYLKKVTNEKSIDLVLNMHSQSLNQVTYWVHSGESTSPRYNKELMLLCNLTIDSNPYFRKDDLKFSKHASRYVEGWFWDNFNGRTIAITFETPYTFYNNKPDGEWVSIENLREMAINNVNAIGDYLQIPSESRMSIAEPKKAAGWKRLNDMEHIYNGESYLKSKREGAKAVYKIKSLPEGEYEIYRWSVAKNVKVSGEGENEWIKYGSHIQQKEGKAKIEIKSEKSGELADNILIVKVKNL